MRVWTMNRKKIANHRVHIPIVLLGMSDIRRSVAVSSILRTFWPQSKPIKIIIPKSIHRPNVAVSRGEFMWSLVLYSTSLFTLYAWIELWIEFSFLFSSLFRRPHAENSENRKLNVISFCLLLLRCCFRYFGQINSLAANFIWPQPHLRRVKRKYHRFAGAHTHFLVGIFGEEREKKQFFFRYGQLLAVVRRHHRKWSIDIFLQICYWSIDIPWFILWISIWRFVDLTSRRTRTYVTDLLPLHSRQRGHSHFPLSRFSIEKKNLLFIPILRLCVHIEYGMFYAHQVRGYGCRLWATIANAEHSNFLRKMCAVCAFRVADYWYLFSNESGMRNVLTKSQIEIVSNWRMPAIDCPKSKKYQQTIRWLPEPAAFILTAFSQQPTRTSRIPEFMQNDLLNARFIVLTARKSLSIDLFTYIWTINLKMQTKARQMDKNASSKGYSTSLSRLFHLNAIAMHETIRHQLRERKRTISLDQFATTSALRRLHTNSPGSSDSVFGQNLNPFSMFLKSGERDAQSAVYRIRRIFIIII